MKLTIHAFQATLITNKGLYSSYAEFTSGLNIIRAENTSGKTGMMNGILYALGLEVLSGKRNMESMKPVYYDSGDFEGERFSVLESYVELEISNNKNETITLRRQIKGQKDPKMVEVVFGRSVTNKTHSGAQVTAYYVGIEGAAQRESGFHYFLSDFLDLNLPYVNRFKGDDVPLYVECIAPLFFIEQVRGWSGIQATLPLSFGIRNVAKVAVEHVLALDVIENKKLRVKINEERQEIRQKWSLVIETFKRLARLAQAKAFCVPVQPTAHIPEQPWLGIEHEEKTITIDDYLCNLRESILETQIAEIAPTDQDRTRELEKKLSQWESNVLMNGAKTSGLRNDIFAENEEMKKLNARLEFVEKDILRNRDVKRLQNFGMESEISSALGMCPTCLQEVEDSLVHTPSKVMSIEENISFLKSEKDTITLLISASKERIERLEDNFNICSASLSKARKAVRDIKKDLQQSQKFSLSEIRKSIQLQEEVSRLEILRDDFENSVDDLHKLSIDYLDFLDRESKIPKEYFSSKDKDKIQLFSESIAFLINQFGFRSTGMQRLHISYENYKPTCDDFEISFGASASDNIRLIWAYTLALLKVSEEHETNHWGVIMFDEPEQQNMKGTSSDALYREISNTFSNAGQIIIATSGEVESISEWVKGIHCNLIELGEKVIRPVD